MSAAMVLGVQIATWLIAARLLTGWPDQALVVVTVALLPIPVALVVGPSTRLPDVLVTGIVSLVAITAVALVAGAALLLTLDRVPTREDRALVAVSMLASALAALLYAPIRDRTSGFARRLESRGRGEPGQVLRTFESRLSRAIPLEELLRQVAEMLREALALDRAELWSGSDGLLDRVISVPDAPARQLSLASQEEAVVARAGVSGGAWARVWLPPLLEPHPDASVRVAPVTYAGELLGLLVCARPAEGDPFNDEEERVLAELARRLGLVMHNVRLDAALQASLDELRHKADELQASRARVVAASDATRRQIERDLHDGAQQYLVGLVAQLRLAVQLGKSDRRAADAMLEELGHGLLEAVKQLRTLAHGIYPPLLVERGLPEALAAATARTGVPTEVAAAEDGRYPPDLEAAVYFCCVEALQNAVKHAGPDASIKVRVWEESGALLFEVIDDGVGFDPSGVRRSGAGLVNMRDRVGAIGGSLGIQSAPGRGTRVAGRIPLRR